jgi:hypothetical protein
MKRVRAKQRRLGNHRKTFYRSPGLQLRQHCQDHPIARREARPGHLPTHHGEVVAQHGDLYILASAV